MECSFVEINTIFYFIASQRAGGKGIGNRRGNRRGTRGEIEGEVNRNRETHPTTSCALLAASGSTFRAIFPLPPRPVVYTSPFSVGVSSITGSRSEALVPMFPAPPRPWESGVREEEEERRLVWEG
jgi:hypothetical protein